ncbi:mobilization protein, partial [Streptomyces sp. NPDC001274]
QAEAAHRAAEHLRAAYQAAAEHPMALLHQRGARLAPIWQRHHATAVRQALPELADRLIAEPGWSALMATLDEAQDAGHNPVTLLTQAAARRELDTAEGMSDVLVWRLRRMADLPADPQNSRSQRSNGALAASSPSRAMQTGIGPASTSPRRR